MDDGTKVTALEAEVGQVVSQDDRIQFSEFHVSLQRVRRHKARPFIFRGKVQQIRAELAGVLAAHDIEEFLLPMFDMADQHAYLNRIARALR